LVEIPTSHAAALLHRSIVDRKGLNAGWLSITAIYVGLAEGRGQRAEGRGQRAEGREVNLL
jgi:hypothetical protein